MAVMFAVITGSGVFSQTTHDHSQMASVKTESIKVWGNCDICKARIEKAAKIEGVSKAEWNNDTKLLMVVFNPVTVTSDTIQKSIAAVGHDTEKYRADDKVYNNLPGCCKYR